MFIYLFALVLTDLSLQMLFTWDTTDLCIVFPSWHISGTGSLVFSLLAVVLLTAGYEAIREISRRYESYAKGAMEGPRGESPSFLQTHTREVAEQADCY
jgi:copper transporter 1